jgi:hypothetical protein
MSLDEIKLNKVLSKIEIEELKPISKKPTKPKKEKKK